MTYISQSRWQGVNFSLLVLSLSLSFPLFLSLSFSCLSLRHCQCQDPKRRRLGQRLRPHACVAAYGGTSPFCHMASIADDVPCAITHGLPLCAITCLWFKRWSIALSFPVFSTASCLCRLCSKNLTKDTVQTHFKKRSTHLSARSTWNISKV